MADDDDIDEEEFLGLDPPSSSEEREEEGELDAVERRGGEAKAPSGSYYGPRFTGLVVPGRQPVAGTHSWRPEGPGNVGGRIRALVVDPQNPRHLLAGSASGGLFRTEDGGENWEALWHDQASLSIGALAIAVAAGGDRVVWIGTGEKDRVSGAGVWRLTIPAAGPAVLDQVGTLAALAALGGGTQRPVSFEAAAAPPDETDHCWLVGPTGVYRFRAGAWTRWDAGTEYTDVKFVGGDAATHARYLVLARVRNERGDLIKVPDPYAMPAGGVDPIAVAIADVANRARPLPALAGRSIANARLAIAPASAAVNQDRVYVVYIGADERVVGFRRSDAAPAASWSARGWDAIGHEFAKEQGQGDYNLCLAVDPGDRHRIAFGMVDAFFSSNSGSAWTKALDSAAYDKGDHAQHADQHALVFVPPIAPGPTQLWVANDGGIAITERFTIAAGDAANGRGFPWRLRIHGLVVGQAYDLTQSSLVPDLHGASFQDMGGWYTGGGASWRYVSGGDGLAIGFDPVDPYRLVTTYQGEDAKPDKGADDNLFGGHKDFRAHDWRNPPRTPPGPSPATTPPILRERRALFRGIVPQRVLSAGVVGGDRGTFEDSQMHPTRPGRIVHIRQRRVYNSVDGTSWQVARVGNRLELLLHVRHRRTVGAGRRLGGGIIRVVGGAFHKLGLLPRARSDLRHPPVVSPREEQLYDVHLVGGAGPDFGIVAGDTLDLEITVFDGERAVPAAAAPAAAHRNRFTRPANVVFTAAETTFVTVIDHIQRALDVAAANLRTDISAAHSELTFELRALPAFAGWGDAVELITRDVGVGVSLEIGGLAAPKLRVQAGQYKGSAGQPVVVTVQGTSTRNFDAPDPPTVDPVDTETLTARLVPAAASTYTFQHFAPATTDAERRANAEFKLDGPSLARGLASAYGAIDVSVRATSEKAWIRLVSSGTPMKKFSLPAGATSTARAGISAGATSNLDGGPFFVLDLIPKKWRRYDLTPVPAGPISKLRINVGGTDLPLIEFRAADFRGALTDVTVEEVAGVLDAALSAHGVSVHVERAPHAGFDIGRPTEAAYLESNPDVIWLGARDGSVYRTIPVVTPGVLDWEPVSMLHAELGWEHWVEAIAPISATRAFIGLDGSSTPNLWEVDGATLTPRITGLTRGDVSPLYEGPSRSARIYGLEIDPVRAIDATHPPILYAATDLGVFKSDDGAATWVQFSEGLPNATTLDLALDHRTRTLRAAVWGRGIWKRHIGTEPVHDTLLHLRANPRDVGRRPAPHGPDLFARTPSSVTAVRSPDIKNVSIPAPGLGDIDGTEMDDHLDHEPPFAGMTSRVLVQPHNGGAFKVDDVRVIALWCDATVSVPPIPGAFWADVSANAVTANAPWGPWQRLGDVNLGTIPPGSSKVAAFAKIWSNAELDGVEQVALAAFVTTGRTAPAAVDAGVADLAVNVSGFAVRLSPVLRGAGLDRVHLASSKPRFTDFDDDLGASTRSNLQLGPLAGGLPATYVRTKAAGAGFALAGRRAHFDIAEDTPAGAQRRRINLAFDNAGFGNPAAVTAAELRAFLGRELAKETLLIQVADGRVALAIRRSPADRGARAGFASWGMAEIVCVPTATAASAALFAPFQRFAPGAASDTSDRRFVVRVWNDGDLVSQNAEVRLFAIDPLAATPATTAIGGAQPIVRVDPGGSALVDVVGRIPTPTGDAVLVVATVHHPDDPAPALPATWDGFHAVVTRSDNVGVRTMRKE